MSGYELGSKFTSFHIIQPYLPSLVIVIRLGLRAQAFTLNVIP